MMPVEGSGWRKSSFSGVDGCLEVLRCHDEVQIRDSKDPDGPVLTFTTVEWRAFLCGVRHTEFDLDS
jgi:hypothetical protein